MRLRSLGIRCLVTSIVLLFALEVYCQRPMRRPSSRQPQTTQSETGKTLKERLWYGGNVALGFSGNNIESVFLIGLAPMVGYKITPNFSVGPRVDFNYTYYKRQVFGPVISYNLYSGGIGPFARYKFFNILFLHTEYQIEWAQFPSLNFDGTKETQIFNNLFVGLGYNAGGGEILILYNLFDQTSRNTLGMPISIRFGFTINF